jgi:hypothetical protein
MKKTASLMLFLLTFTSGATFAFAQGGGDSGAPCAALGCGVVGIIVYLLIILVMLGGTVALIIFIIKWIRRDATARGMPNADTIKWFGLLGLLGLLIYVLQRPQGNVMPCPSCGQSRMQGLPQCPHCGQP